MSFDPSQISGLVGWWDATNATTVTTSGTATVGLGNTADGATLAQWFESTGKGLTFKGTSATNGYSGPGLTYKASGALGKACLLCNGGAMFLPASVLATLSASDLGSYSILALVNKYTGDTAPYGALMADGSGGDHKFFFIAYNGALDRYNGVSSPSFAEAASHGIGYTFASTGSAQHGQETFYVDGATASASEASVVASTTGSDLSLGSFNSVYPWNGEIYEIALVNNAVSNSTVAQVMGYWNSKYGTSFGTSGGPLAAGTLSTPAKTNTTVTVTASGTAGGTSPYTYQWYRSTTSGQQGSLVSNGGGVTGATTGQLSDAGLTPGTTVYYTLAITDATSTTVYTPQLQVQIYGNRVIKFANLGDSITAYNFGNGTPPTIYGNLIRANDATAYPQSLNLAVPGQKIRDLATTNGGGGLITGYITQMQSFGATVALLMEGTNDAAAQAAGTSGYSATAYAQDLTDVCTRIVAAGIKVYINDIMWRSDTGTDTIIQTYNAQIAGVCNGTTIIRGSTTDYSFFAAHPSELQDGLHPTAQGDLDLAQQWYNATPTVYTVSTPPPAVTGLAITGVTYGGTLSWTASAGATGYDVAKNGTLVSSGQAGTSYAFTGALASDTFTVTAKAGTASASPVGALVGTAAGGGTGGVLSGLGGRGFFGS